MGVSKAIASLGCGPHERLLRIAARSIRPFAARHGYDLHLHTAAIDPSRPAPWSKIKIIAELLDRYDDVLWLDSDLVIVDGREDLPATDFMALVQHDTGSETMPNSGVWLLHSSPETKRFLDEVWAQEDLIDHRWWENAAICRLLGYSLDPVAPGAKTNWLERTDFLDPRWNSIPSSSASNPRIKHYPGYKTRTRAAFMLRDNLLRRRGA
jgi:hypothetical protein